MEKIKCYDENGNYVDTLVQWDQGQIVYIDNLENGAIPNVHFAFQSNDVSWEFSNITSLSNNKIKINIPNVVMQSHGRLHLFFYYGNGNTYTTKYVAIIIIREKPRPDDYDHASLIETIDDYIYDDDIESGSGIESISQIKTDINSLFSLMDTKITSPTTAVTGNFLKVSAVDSNGKPTKWETVNIQTTVENICRNYIETELLGGAS